VGFNEKLKKRKVSQAFLIFTVQPERHLSRKKILGKGKFFAWEIKPCADSSLFFRTIRKGNHP
jgi:hypothetical protein